MEKYLQSVKASVLNLNAEDCRVHVVLGNEACDLDSAVCAIIYAFLLHQAKIRSTNNTLFVPLLNIRKSELYMHTDVTHLLKKAKVSLELLLFRDDLDLTSLHSSGRLSLILVDHNRLSREDSVLEDCVIEIVDHHAALPCERRAETRRCEFTMEMVGSCSTLVAEKLLQADVSVLDEQTALLLYGTIVLDTGFFSNTACTPKDKVVAEKLTDFLPDIDGRTLFRSMHEAKWDVSGLSLLEILRRDLKCTSNDTMKIAVSTISASLKDFFQKTNTAEADLERFAADNNCQIVVLMGVQVNPDTMEVQRQLAVYSAVQGYREQITDLLEAVSTRGPKLGLQSLPSPYATVALYRQSNVAATRKVVLPLLHTFLHGDRSLSVSADVVNGSDAVKNGCHDSDHDLLAAESEDIVLLTDPIGNPAGAASQLHVLGVGDPMSHAGSSQSSNQNSCPYTPQNSCTDGGLELDPYARQILPSFNSREMMEKIESKRGKLRGYSGDDEATDNVFYPFTPKNSFVDGSFEAYVKTAPSFDSGDLLLKVNEKVAAAAAMNEPAADGEVVSGSITVEVPHVTNSHRESSRDPDDADSLDKPKCPEATSLSDRLEKNTDALDTNGSGEMSASSTKTSPFPDEDKEKVTRTTAIDSNNYVTKTDCNNQDRTEATAAAEEPSISNNKEALSHLDAESSHSISSTAHHPTDLDLELAANYQTETVDFPHSPRQLKLLTQSAQGLSLEETVPEEEEEDDDRQRADDDEDFRAVLSPSSDGVKLKKDDGLFTVNNDLHLLENLELESDDDDFAVDSFDDGVLELSLDVDTAESDEQSADRPPSILGRCRRALVSQFSTPIDKGKKTALAKDFSQKMSAIGHLSAIMDEPDGSSTDDVDASILERICLCLGQDGTIRDDYELHERLRSVLQPSEIKEVLANRPVYRKFLEESILDLLDTIDRGDWRSKSSSAANDDDESHRTGRKHVVTLDRSTLDRSLAERFGDELQVGAIFHGSTSKKKRKTKNASSAADSEIDGLRSVPRGTKAYFVESFTEDKRKKIIPLSPSISLGFDDSMSSPERNGAVQERPNTLSTDGQKKKRKIKVNADILNASEDREDERSWSSLSNRSDGEILTPADDLVTPDDIDTPDDLDDSVTEVTDPIPEISAAEERNEERRWRTCVIGGVQRKIDLKVIEPYKKVLSHGGYYGPKRSAIIVFSACYLPDHSRKDYDYVMDNLFLYVLTTLDQLVAEDYVLVYLHGALDRGHMPTFGWLKRCYQMIDRRLRKNLKGLYLVHPTFWLKTIVLMTKPFISSKFSRKLQFVNTLQELADLIPVDQMSIPDKVKQLEFELMIKEKKRQQKSQKRTSEAAATTDTAAAPDSSSEDENRGDSMTREAICEMNYRRIQADNLVFGWL